MKTITGARSLSLATSCAMGAFLAALVAWACDYEKASSGTEPCDTSLSNCLQYSSPSTCRGATAYEINSFPKECKPSGKEATNCNFLMANCSRSVTCTWYNHLNVCGVDPLKPKGNWSQKPKRTTQPC
jgi:hypothetical protein